MAKVKFENFGLFYPTTYHYDGTSFSYDSFDNGLYDCVSFAEYIMRVDMEISSVRIIDAMTGEIAATIEREEFEIDDDVTLEFVCDDYPEFLDDDGFEIAEEFELPEDDYPEFLDDEGFEIIDYFIESEEF